MSHTAAPDWLTYHQQWPEVPGATFPHDAEVPGDYAAAMAYDPKGKNYPEQTVGGMLKIAGLFGIPIDLETYERTKRMVVAPEASDPYLDGGSSKADRRQRFGVVTGTVRTSLIRSCPLRPAVA